MGTSLGLSSSSTSTSLKVGNNQKVFSCNLHKTWPNLRKFLFWLNWAKLLFWVFSLQVDNAQESVWDLIFGDFFQSEKLTEIKPTLSSN